jgi:hypothetical protein
MNSKINKIVQLTLFALFFNSGIHAQVVIGDTSLPEPAALLQIKEYDAIPGPGGETAGRGILLPRVELNDLSDITVLPANASADKKLELTGLLVYNVSNAGTMDEGIYEWDGTIWNQLETRSEVTGSSTKKAVVKTSHLASNMPTVSMGIFEFRIDGNMKPQYKLTSSPPATTTFWYQVARYWDTTNMTTQNGSGFSFDTMSKTFTSGNYSSWQSFHDGSFDSLISNDFRYEVWLADSINNHVYQIQFIIATIALGTPIYAVLVTEY